MRRAYRERARRLHPDVHRAPDAAARTAVPSRAAWGKRAGSRLPGAVAILQVPFAAQVFLN
ncbi:MAG TPA: hypothetical protein VKF37_06685 [Chloroflexota bacterium]|nr:hypothetical protein [Chloroflexota bacterium]